MSSSFGRFRSMAKGSNRGKNKQHFSNSNKMNYRDLTLLQDKGANKRIVREEPSLQSTSPRQLSPSRVDVPQSSMEVPYHGLHEYDTYPSFDINGFMKPKAPQLDPPSKEGMGKTSKNHPLPQEKNKLVKSLVRGNRGAFKGMVFHHDKLDSNIEVIKLGEEHTTSIYDKWGYCLVGSFTGRHQGGKAIFDIQKAWGVKCEIMPHSRGWTIFKFATFEDRERVFNGGPYIARNKTLMLKKVDSGMRLDHDIFLDVPIWVKFFDVPWDYWNTEGLGLIASKIGKPIYSDLFTLERKSSRYARILVEVDISVKPILSYELELVNGERFTQYVEYETFPDYCYHCKMFGHRFEKCGKFEDKI